MFYEQGNRNKTREEWMKWLKYFKNHRYELSKEECLALRDDIKKSSVAEEFFFRTLDPMNKGLPIRSMRANNVVVDFRDIATCIYLPCMMVARGPDGHIPCRLRYLRLDFILCNSGSVHRTGELHYIETSFDLTAKTLRLP